MNTITKAELELDILVKTVPDAVIRHFVPEVLALVKAFGESGQSGGSAPFTAGVISQVVKKLCLHEPITPITGHPDEWGASSIGSGVMQNKRCFGLFKEPNGVCHFNEAIVFRGDIGGTFTGGGVELPSGGTIRSSQKIKEFPFEPKTFYIDVIDTRWAGKDEKVKDPNGDWWTHVLKDEAQLKEVFEYYAA